MEVKCDWCGKIFRRRPSNVKMAEHHFCSRKCQFDWMRGGKSGDIKCDGCEKSFSKAPSKVTGHNFCSKECKARWQSENMSGKSNPFYGKHHTEGTLKKIVENLPDYNEEKNPNWRGGKYKECEICGKKFWVGPSRMSTAHTCSEECKSKWLVGRPKKISPQTREKFRKMAINLSKREDVRRKLSKALSGKNNPMYGKHHSVEFKRRASELLTRRIKKYGATYPAPYYSKELGHPVRSKWEEEIGLILKRNNIPYSYEGKTFSLDGTHYTPDFIALGKIIEAKGWLHDGQSEKYKKFKKAYPELTFIIVGGPVECKELCDIHIPWKERERLVEVLS